jgi:catechol 2,3-dioxygenase-like lactoylglutathione lyase family enzyme
MPGLRIQHVNLLVDDLAAATCFYRDVIGLVEIAAPRQNFKTQFFQVSADQELHVNEIRDAKPERAHLCLVADEFAGIFERARAAGCLDLVVWGRVRRLRSGALQMFLRDPSGNLVEIASLPGAALDTSDPTYFEPGEGIAALPEGHPARVE